MNGYNLTDRQKELLRKLVRCVREEGSEEPISASYTLGQRCIQFFDGTTLEYQGDLFGDLDALCDVDLMGVRYNERGNKLYNIKQAGYDAVDSDFEVPQPIASRIPLTGDDKIAVGIPEQLMLHFKRQISDSWRYKDPPVQIQESLARFRQEHPDPSKVCVIK